jgi:hypothetical protein
MFDIFVNFRRIAIPMLLGLSFFVAACGGSGGDGAPEGPGTGTVALLLTDMPTDDLSEINLSVTGATLIGGQGQQDISVYDGNTRVNLLDLRNYSQPIAFGEVPAGNYTKLRLQINDIELVDLNGVTLPPPKLPANGRIDLLEPGGIEIVPGRMLVARVDIDANKSIHVIQTGNGEYRVRPVVRVEFTLGGLPDELVRVEGEIVDVPEAPAGSFVMCAFDNQDVCLDVSLATDACVFDVEGIRIMPIDDQTFAVPDPVVVIGTYGEGDDNPTVEAIIVEKGAARLFKGIVTSLPDTAGRFTMTDPTGQSITVELQPDCTRLFGPSGETVAAAGLQIDDVIEVEGVIPDDPDVLRAALIVVDADDRLQQLSGTIGEPNVSSGFILATDAGDRCVELADNAVITLVSISTGETRDGSVANIEAGQSADAYGTFGPDGVDGCFNATGLVIETSD